MNAHTPRSREEIEKLIGPEKGWSLDQTQTMQFGAMVELLLDIRDLLQNPPVEIVNVEAPKCTCGEPHISDRIVHRIDGPCYVKDVAPPEKDPQFDDAVILIATKYHKDAKITAGGLRVQLGISYGRASALIDQLEAAGVISKPDANKRRHVV